MTQEHKINATYAGAGGKKPKSPNVTDDNLFSEDTVEVILAMCEGDIEGFVTGDARSFYVGGTPLLQSDGVTTNFKDLVVNTVGFGVDATYPPVKYQLGGESSSTDVGVTLSKDIAVTRITPSGLRGLISSIEFRLNFTQLYIENEDGNFNNTARFQIAFRPASSIGAFQYYRNIFEYRITGKSSSGYVREFVLSELPPLVDDDWEIRVTKFNDDYVVSTSVDKNIAEIQWESFQCVTVTEKSYPNTVTLQIIAKSGDQFTSIPEFYADLKGLIVRVPNTYNGDERTINDALPMWDGSTFTWQYTNNPAWLLHELIMNESFGMRKHYPMVTADPYSFYEAAQYCDELVPDGKGGTHPRYSLNTVLDNAELATDKLAFIAGSFNATITDPLNGRVYVQVDKWREPSVIFTPESVTMEGFNYAIADNDTRYNDLTVSFINPELGYQPDKRRIFNQTSIDLIGRVPLDFEAVGCTNVQEALRRAYMRMATSEFEVTQVTFITTRIGVLLQPYDNFWLSDATMGWGVSSRLVRTVGSTIRIRDPIITTSGTAYEVYLQSYSGVLKFTALATTTGECTDFIYSGAFPSGYFDEVPYEAQVGFQSVLGNTDIGLMKPFRVVGVQEVDDNPNLYRIIGLEVNEPKYDATDNVTPSTEVPYSFKIPDKPLAPYDLQAFSGTGQLELNSDGTVVSRISVEWKIPPSAFVDHFEIQYQVLDAGLWNTLTTTGNQVFIAPAKDGVEYEIQVRSVNALGRYSDHDYITHVVLGKSEPPHNVTGFNSVSVDYGLRLYWDAVPDADIGLYEIRVGADWNTGELVTQIKGTQYAWNMQEAGTYSLWIKAVDTSGNYSLDASFEEAVIAAPNAPIITMTILATDIVLNWTVPDSKFPVANYEIRRGASASVLEDATIIATTAARQFKLTANFTGNGKLWVVPIDAVGNRGTAGYASFTVELPVVGSVRLEVIDNNVLLRWVSEAKTFPIRSHRIRRGATLLDSEEIYQSSGTFAALLETKSGLYTYWIIPIDSAGNEGTAYSIVASVSQPPDYVLFVDRDSDFSGTRTNMIVRDSLLVGAVSETETYDEHFSDHGYLTWQDAVDDGYPYFLTPALTDFEYEETFDYGTLITGATIRVLIEKTILNGTLSFSQVTISIRAEIADPWLDYIDQDYVAGGNFRYIKIKYEGSLDTDAAIIAINRINTKLETKLKVDSGKGYANASDVGGTLVTFGEDFFDINYLGVNYDGIDAIDARYDFLDAPDPTDFKVLLFDQLTGDRVSGNFRWLARGY